MELIYDDLVFDSRNQDDLFPLTNSGQPQYADILKRWATGERIPDDKQKIVTSILIFYPDYILKNGKTKEFIELIRDSLNQPDLQNPDNDEKGLFLYTLFYFLLKSGAQKEALQVLCDLVDVFEHYTNSSCQTLQDPVLPSDPDHMIYPEEYPPDKPDRIQIAYLEIITLIIDANELLHLEPDFNLNRLPLHNKTLGERECRNARGDALYLYEQKSFSEAKRIYHRLLTERYELPGTLIHLARLELTIGNTFQAEIHSEMAWRHRDDAPPYVMVRILWFKICLLFLYSGNREEIDSNLDMIKTLLQNNEAIMQWSVQPLLEHLKPQLQENDYNLLTALIEAMSNTKDILKPDSLTN